MLLLAVVYSNWETRTPPHESVYFDSNPNAERNSKEQAHGRLLLGTPVFRFNQPFFAPLPLWERPKNLLPIW
jgi:hypothetical protein